MGRGRIETELAYHQGEGVGGGKVLTGDKPTPTTVMATSTRANTTCLGTL